MKGKRRRALAKELAAAVGAALSPDIYDCPECNERQEVGVNRVSWSYESGRRWNDPTWPLAAGHLAGSDLTK